MAKDSKPNTREGKKCADHERQKTVGQTHKRQADCGSV